MEAIEARIRRVMSDVLNVEVASIDDAASPKTIERWDSLRQMNLIVALEEEFSILFEDARISTLQSFSAICRAISEVVRPS